MITANEKVKPFTGLGYSRGMGYAERLQAALDQADKTRGDLANELGVSRQAIGMILTKAGGRERTLSTENNARAAHFLRVDPIWLATGDGDMNSAGTLSSAALDIATLYDLIPVSDRIRRARAYNAATGAILDVLHELPEISGVALDRKKSSV